MIDRPVNKRAISGPIYEAPRQPGIPTAATYEYTDKAGAAAIDELKRLAHLSNKGNKE